MKKIVIVGTINDFCLETSYSNAAMTMGHDVIRFDPAKEVQKHVKFGTVGKKLFPFIPVEIWYRKMNRELVVMCKNSQPDYIFIFGTSKVLFGALATIRTFCPRAKVVWVWPDMPLNLEQNNLNLSKLIDLTACYSEKAVPLFQKLGFNNVHFIPLAGDTYMHGKTIPKEDNYRCDLSFVGMWRPEREKVLRVINNNFQDISIEIHGNYWQRDCKDKNLLRRFKGIGFFGKDLADHFNRSRININIIDDTNYPAANMRFFEIPTAGGLQITSPCPEMENEFVHMQHVLYFRNEEELINAVTLAMNNKEFAMKVREEGQMKLKEKHTYSIRLADILNLLS